MLTIDDLDLDRKLSVGIALVFSSEVLHLYEAKYPNDLRLRKAIESVIRWLQNPCEETHDAVNATAHAAFEAAAHAAFEAAHAAFEAADAAVDAADAARAAASAAYADYAAAYAADAAAAAAAYAADKDKYIHNRIVKILPLIVEYKIEKKQSFNDAEKVLEYLNDEDKVSLLFNLNILR